jgi:hypothetical protein
MSSPNYVFNSSFYDPRCSQHCRASVTITHRDIPTTRSAGSLTTGEIQVGAEIDIPLGCGLRVFNGDGTFDDYLQSFVYSVRENCPKYANANRTGLKMAVFGYDMARDNRVLVMDGAAETAGDQQNVCRGFLFEPGYYGRFDSTFSSTLLSMHVLGSARVTTFREQYFMGTQQTYRAGIFHRLNSGMSMQVQGPGQVRSVQLSAKWELVASLGRDFTGGASGSKKRTAAEIPEWPVLEYGVSFDSATTYEEANEMADEVESSCELSASLETTVGVSMGMESKSSVKAGTDDYNVEAETETKASVEFEAGIGAETSGTSSSGASSSSASAFAATVGSSRTASTECTYACQIPSHVENAVGGTGEGVEVNDGIGNSCPKDGGKQVYIWRWTGRAATVMPGESGVGSLGIETCHTQCTCTPAPPACAFSDCADLWCTKCKTAPPPPPPPASKS